MYSLPPRRGVPLRNRSDLPVRRLSTHLPRRTRQDQWWHVRDALHSPLGDHDMGVLVEHYRGRLARCWYSWILVIYTMICYDMI
jgi:hypothetical protein